MANFNVPQIPMNGINVPQVSNPYGNLMFTPPPYDNFMGKNNSQNMQNQVQFLKCRPVSSKEEAVASQIDLDGSLWVFIDVGNGKIYTKQINSNGTATFKTYNYVEDETPYSTTEYVTKDEFNKVIQSLVAAIQAAPEKAQQKQAQNTNQKASSKDVLPLNF